MNSYDLSQMRLEDYQMDPEAAIFDKEYQRNLLAYRIIVIGIALGTIVGILKWNGIGFLFFEFILAICALFFALQYIEMKMIQKAGEGSVKTLHDYYYLKYWRLKRPKNRARLLLILSQCDIRMGQYEDAVNALNMLDYQKLSLTLKTSYHLQWSILQRLNGNEEGFIQNVQMYQSFALSRKKQAPDYINNRLSILHQGTTEQLLELLDTSDRMKISTQVLRVVAISFVMMMAALLFFSGKGFLPDGMEYRNWFSITGSLFFAIYGLAFVTYLMIAGGRSRKMQGKSATGYYVLYTVLLMLYILAMLFFGFIYLFDYQVESRLSDGKILVTQSNFLDDNTYYVCKRKTAFFRVYLYDSDAEGNKVSEKSHSTENDSIWEQDDTTDQNTIESSEAAADAKSQENTEDETSSGQSDASNMSDEDAVIQAIYQAIYDAEYADTMDGLTFAYSAKGSIYAWVGEAYEADAADQASGAVTSRIRLVYDRESTNGVCDEVVCYEYHYDAEGNEIDNTSILEFYAVVKDTLEVIPGDKTGWADTANEAYREATGE